MRDDVRLVSDLSALATGAAFVVGLVVLGFRLAQIQLVDAAKYLEDGSRQAARRVQTAGPRGRIIARDGTVLADNRASVSIVVSPEGFQRRNWSETVSAISNAIESVASAIETPSPLSANAIARHVRQQLARPLVVWRDLDDGQIARFVEREREFPGFECVETEERTYPEGRLAAHVIGYVGRGETESAAGERFNFRDKEMKGRAGLEAFYDGYLRGAPGELSVTVDARGFAVAEETVVEARRGPDLNLTIDPKIQRSVERQLRGEYAACAVIDPRDGAVLALASAPAYDLNLLVPRLSPEMQERYVGNHACRNRACFETYAPGSTFKPVTALVMITALSFGPEAGFITGSLSAILSNLWFGQGPWTPFQMFAWGMIGFFAGVFAKYLENHTVRMCVYVFFAGMVYSFIMDVWSVMWAYNSFNLKFYIASITSAAPYTAVYAISNVIFILLLRKPFSEKLGRIKIKYGI